MERQLSNKPPGDTSSSSFSRAVPSPVVGELSQENKKTGVKKKEERKAVMCSTVVQCTSADLRTAIGSSPASTAEPPARQTPVKYVGDAGAVDAKRNVGWTMRRTPRVARTMQ